MLFYNAWRHTAATKSPLIFVFSVLLLILPWKNLAKPSAKIFATYYSNHSCPIIRILLRSLSHGSCSSDWGKMRSKLRKQQQEMIKVVCTMSALMYTHFHQDSLNNPKFSTSQYGHLIFKRSTENQELKMSILGTKG